jgi:hypothetical protein
LQLTGRTTKKIEVYAARIMSLRKQGIRTSLFAQLAFTYIICTVLIRCLVARNDVVVSENIISVTPIAREVEVNSKLNDNRTFNIIPYMESSREREYVNQIHALPPISVSGDRKSVIAFSLYGNNPKYVQGAIENAKLKDTYFPGWTLRYYVLPSFPTDIINTLKGYGAEVEYPPVELGDEKLGMFWRFLVADDPKVERFIIRDTDSRLNARDRFAVEEWMNSEKSCHVIRDHPLHYLIMNGGLWGGKRGFLKNRTMIDLIRGFRKSKRCRRIWGCDNLFLEFVLWDLIKDDQIGHDSFYCKDKPNSVGFPTQRDTNYQFVGQAFDNKNIPVQEHLQKIRNEAVVTKCLR